jgi:hypothetical protein
MFDFDVITGPGPLAALAAKEAGKDVSKKPTATEQTGRSGTAKEVQASLSKSGGEGGAT